MTIQRYTTIIAIFHRFLLMFKHRILCAGTFKLLSKCIDGKGFSGTKRYLGDLGKTVSTFSDKFLFNFFFYVRCCELCSLLMLQLKTAGSNILFAAVTEVSDAVLRGAETNGFNGMVNLFS